MERRERNKEDNERKEDGGMERWKEIERRKEKVRGEKIVNVVDCLQKCMSFSGMQSKVSEDSFFN